MALSRAFRSLISASAAGHLASGQVPSFHPCFGEACSGPSEGLDLLQRHVSTGMLEEMEIDDLFRTVEEGSDEDTVVEEVVWDITNNNLGGKGPDKGGPKNMRSSNIATVGGRPVDLVITAKNKYKPKVVEKNGIANGNPNYLRLNFAGGHITELLFSFVDQETGAPVTLEKFHLTFFDVDHGRGKLREYVGFKSKEVRGVTLTKKTKLERLLRSKGWTAVQSTGNYKGNGFPFDPMDMTKAQMHRSVAAKYTDVSSFRVKLGTPGGRRSSGRNFFISGMSELNSCMHGKCDIFGDPHISTFDKNPVSLLAAGPSQVLTFDSNPGSEKASLLDSEEPAEASEPEYFDHSGFGDIWIVKNEHVQIQGRYDTVMGSNHTFLRALAVGGPFLLGKTLFIGGEESNIMWHGEEILASMPSYFEDTGIIQAHYLNNTEFIHRNTTAPGLDIKLRWGLSLLVNRFPTHLNMRVEMGRLAGGQTGECGNFNSDASDDKTTLVQQRASSLVKGEENLFPTSFKEWRAKFGY